MVSKGRQTRKRGQQRSGVCAYCDEVGPITRDHVFAQTLFIGTVENPLTVPACSRCHDDKSKGESVIRDLVTFEVNGERHPDSRVQVAKIARAVQSNRSIVGTTMLEKAELYENLSSNGIFLGYTVRVPTEPFRTLMLKTVEYIVRGLFYQQTSRPIGASTPVEVSLVESHLVAETNQHFDEAPVTHSGSIGNSVASWVGWVSQKDLASSRWRICLNGGVFFIGWTGRRAENVRAYDAAVNQQMEAFGPLKGEIQERAPSIGKVIDGQGRILVQYTGLLCTCFSCLA